MGLIRTTLALSVVFAHVGLNVLVGGTLAVQMFYVISGFLIAHVVSIGVYTNLRTFYLNRFLRLYPAYIVVAVLSLVALAIAKSPKFAEFGELPFGARGLLAAVNALLFGQDWSSSSRPRGPHSLSPTMSSTPIRSCIDFCWCPKLGR